jgi:MraZ protein
MFRGLSFHTIDEKGRIIIPSRFRDVVRAGGHNGVMMSMMDKSLFAYTYEEWNKIEQKVLDMAEKSESMRRFRRIFIGGAHEVLSDKQGRVLIPPTLRQYANLEKEIVMVGVLDHFEIWSRENWERENQELFEDLKNEDVRNEIAKLGL